MVVTHIHIDGTGDDDEQKVDADVGKLVPCGAERRTIVTVLV